VSTSPSPVPDPDLRFDVVSLDGRLLDSFLLGEVGSWRAAVLWGWLAAKTDRDGSGEEE